MQESIEKSNSKKVIVIGGGPAGLTAAYKLSKAGVESIVLEKDQIVGGISRTVNYKNYYFDIGGHRFFTRIQAVEKMWKDVLGDNLLHNKRLSRIYYNKKFFYYPLSLFNVFSGLGFRDSALILASYLYSHIFPSKKEETFEQYVSNRFGKRLYRIFFKTYSEKVWGMPCSALSSEWASQRMNGLSLWSAVRNAFVRNSNNGGNKTAIKTLIDTFDYPKLGSGMMWQSVMKISQGKGSQVCLGAEVEGILWAKNRIESLEVRINGEKKLIHGTHFISSMPIKELIEKLKPRVPDEALNAARGLKYRDFLIVALIVNKRDIFSDHWIYIHDSDVKLGRIQNFKNWSSYMAPDPNKTLLGLEYFCFKGDELWSMSDKDMIELGKRELETLGLAQASDVEDATVIRMPKAYPLYDSNYRKSLQLIRKFLSRFDNLYPVGRNGMHRYNNMDHSMFTAMLAVENIIGANHDLWGIKEYK